MNCRNFCRGGIPRIVIEISILVIILMANGAGAAELSVKKPTNGFGIQSIVYPSIQAAIDGANDGDTIIVSTGTYNENLTISNKSNLTITGAGIGSTIIQPTVLKTTGVGHKYDPNMHVALFVNRSINITIQGMTISGGGLSPNAAVFWNTSSGEIKNSRITDTTPITGLQTGQGIAVDASSGQISSLNVTNVQIDGFNKNGIDAIDGNGGTSPGTITVNVNGGSITGIGPTATIAQNGIVFWKRGGGTVGGSINGVSISNLNYTPTTNEATGILEDGGVAGSISNSLFSNVESYIYASSNIDASTGNTFDGVAASSAADAQLFAIEDGIYHKLDDATLGLVTIKPNNVYVTPASGSIQRGIDAVPIGGMVNVAAGTYTEQPDISKALTLKGVGAGSTTIRSPSNLSTKFTTSGPNKPIVYVNKTLGVTIQQLKIDGAGLGNSNYRMDGIAYDNSSGTVDYVTITGIRENPLNGNQQGTAIYAYNADGISRTLNATNNTINDFQKNGLALSGNGLTVNVRDNIVTGAGPTAAIAQNGIQVSSGAAGTIGPNNVVSNISYTGPSWASSGILVYIANADVLQNTVNNAQVGIYFVEGNGLVKGNTITGSAAGTGVSSYWGIDVSDPPQAKPSPSVEPISIVSQKMSIMSISTMTVNVTGNTLIGGRDSSSSVGLEADAGYYGIVNVTFNAGDNRISGWGYGVEVYQCQSGCTGSIFDHIAVNHNNISGNTINMDANVASDGTKNWWGTAVRSWILPTINGSVSFDPYYVDPAMTILSNVAPANVYINPAYIDGSAGGHFFGYDAFNTIQEGINAVASGGTVNVAAGTYTEPSTVGPQISIGKNVSIAGADKNTTIIKPSANTGVGVTLSDVNGWFLVNAGFTFNLRDITLDGTGKNVSQAIRSHGAGTIQNTIIKNMGYEPSGPAYKGMGIVTFDSNMIISNNTLSNIGRVGIYAGSNVTNAVISGNTYTGKGNGNWLDYGIEVERGGNATIKGNTINNCKGVAAVDGSTSAGILVTTYFNPGTGATITDNNITNNSVGIQVGYLPSDTSTVTAHYNNFTGNGEGVNSTGPIVNATYNWWGNDSGPGPVGPGSGDNVSTNVLYVPWLPVDITPPASVENLVNMSYASNYINWTWTDPTDLDFAKVKVYLDGVYKQDVLKGVQHYNATVSPGTYTIGTITVDTHGNENATMKTHTATTILPPVRYINGTVIDSVNKTGIPGATVSTTGVSTTTNGTGVYSLAVGSGIYPLTATSDITYYTNNSVTVSTVLSAVVVQDIELVKKPTGNITGSVTTG